MKKLSLILCLLSGLVANTVICKPITTIFFDIESIFESDDMRASGYIGKINAARYIISTGHKPSQTELFKQLKNIKAISTEHTYNNNLEMPLILADWLSQKQSNSKIKEIIQKYLSNKSLSDIEVKVLMAIVNMMLTPQHLADIHKVRSKMEMLLKTLHQKNYKLYLVGNWAHINSLKNAFGDIFKYFTDTIVSGDNHLLKPQHAYYQNVLESTHTHSNQAIWIETEPKFVSKAEQYQYNVILGKNYHSVVAGLQNYGISI